eukprot:2911088-Ditylum_brightwellii.AAC.1
MTNTNHTLEGNSDTYYNEETVAMDPNNAPDKGDNTILDDNTVEQEEPADDKTLELEESAEDVTDIEEQKLIELEAVARAA